MHRLTCLGAVAALKVILHGLRAYVLEEELASYFTHGLSPYGLNMSGEAIGFRLA